MRIHSRIRWLTLFHDDKAKVLYAICLQFASEAPYKKETIYCHFFIQFKPD